MLVGIVTCCILTSLVLLWKKTGRIVDMVDDETQTLEEGKRNPEIPMKVMIQTLSWCSHCDPSDALGKRTWRRRVE